MMLCTCVGICAWGCDCTLDMLTEATENGGQWAKLGPEPHQTKSPRKGQALRWKVHTHCDCWGHGAQPSPAYVTRTRTPGVVIVRSF